MSEAAPTSARAAIVREANAPVDVEDIELDAPGPGEVRVRILATGVCHTDLHACMGNFGTEFPYYLGHEATGVVEAHGPDVTTPALGTTVVINWRAACGDCRFCAAGRANFCARPLVAGIEVETRAAVHTIVTLGDSITDGAVSKSTEVRGWPGRLAERLAAARGPVRYAVSNQGIGGNRLLHDGLGTTALGRFDRDVLAVPGVTHLIVLEGINDIGMSG